MQALRETQVEDHAAITELKGGVSGLTGDVADLKRGQAALEHGQANPARGQEVIIDLLRRRNGGDPSASAG